MRRRQLPRCHRRDQSRSTSTIRRTFLFRWRRCPPTPRRTCRSGTCSFEHQIGDNMTFSMAYVGDKGTHLVTYYNYNRQVYGVDALRRRAIRQVAISRPSGLSIPRPLSATRTTTPLQVALNRRFTQGLAVRRILYLVARHRRLAGRIRYLHGQRQLRR